MLRLSVLIESERDNPSQKRTIIAKFLNYKDKEKVLREVQVLQTLGGKVIYK